MSQPETFIAFSSPVEISTNIEIPQIGMHVTVPAPEGEEAYELFVTDPFYSEGLFEEVDPVDAYGIPRDQAIQLQAMNSHLRELYQTHINSGDTPERAELQVLVEANRMLRRYDRETEDTGALHA